MLLKSPKDQERADSIQRLFVFMLVSVRDASIALAPVCTSNFAHIGGVVQSGPANPSALIFLDQVNVRFNSPKIYTNRNCRDASIFVGFHQMRT